MAFSRLFNCAKSSLHLKQATVDPVIFALIRILVTVPLIRQYISSSSTRRLHAHDNNNNLYSKLNSRHFDKDKSLQGSI